MKLKKGDNVIVLSGSRKGRTGTITATIPEKNQVIIDGINVMKKHHKPSTKMPQGGITEESYPMDASKVGIVHPSKKDKASRVGYKITNDKKVRVYRANDKEIK